MTVHIIELAIAYVAGIVTHNRYRWAYGKLSALWAQFRAKGKTS